MATEGDLNKANGDIFYAGDVTEIVSKYGTLAAQNALEGLEHGGNINNQDYLGADIFTDADGAKNTVDTGNSTSFYESSDKAYGLPGTETDEASGDTTHDPNSFSNPGNAFDSNDTTAATSSLSNSSRLLGKTFSSPKKVTWVKVKATMTFSSGSGSSTSISLATYNGSTWTDIKTLASGGASSISYDSELTLFLDSTVQGIAVRFSSGMTYSVSLFTLEYSSTFQALSTVETNTIINEIVPDSIVVYGKAEIPANTSITVDVSDDGGSTFSLTGQSLNTAINTSTFTTGNLALKFNLATTDTSVTPKLYGYGVAITDV